MNRAMVPMLLMVGMLSACGSGEVKPGAAFLRAEANVRGTSYLFDCDPAANSATPLFLDDDITFSCTSKDSKAFLTLRVQQLTTENGSTETRSTAALSVFGPPLVNYDGPTNGSILRFGFRSLEGRFTAQFLADVKVSGEYNLSGN